MCKLQNLFHLLTISTLSILSSCSSSRLPGYLRRHMSPAVGACDDFYGHACGGWAEAHKERAYRSQLEQLDHVYHGRLATLLEQSPAANQPRFVQLLRDNYNACRKMQGHFKAAQLVRWLATWGNISLGQQLQTETDYRRLNLLFDHGFNLQSDSERFFKAESESQLASTLEAVQWLLQLQLPWPVGVGDVADFRPLTRVQFRRLYRALQPLDLPPQLLWLEIKQLERQLCQPPHQEAEPESGAEAEAEADGVSPLAEQLLPADWLLPLPLDNAGMLPATHWSHYVRRLPTVLATIPVPQLMCYALLRLLHQLQLRPAPTFGRQECAAQSRHLLTHAAVWLLQQQQSEEELQLMHATMQELFAQLRQRFKLMLLFNRNQFRADTQRILLDKLQRMRLRVSVLPQADHATQRQQLEAHYANLQLNDSDYYANLLATLQQIEQWKRDRERDQDEDGDRDVASLHLLQSDGYGSYASPFFLPDRNLVMLPFSLLATPLYRPNQASVLTQSALGFLIAHEMSHGFTPTDVHYDGRGNVASSQQKMHIQRNTRFANQIRCLRHRYNDVTDIDEKFADINGLSLAYEAFNATTPSTNTSMQQLFFLNFAQFFCQDSRQLEDIPLHGGSRERVNDAVANLESFARAFSCEGHKKHKCRLY
ncbi:neprilysin-2 [Drosophila innubila]|uniref:neprilysin-2 n=1 Tax=Drosophila innubila TaxID=198719 RepID=UPI00148D293D|nr:neprilysin-2 [Drosophila innubila]